MYHGFARIDGEWVSFGLHVPSSQWTNVFQTLRRAYGPENVKYVFWPPYDHIHDVAAVRSRAVSDVQLANEAQRQWNDGKLKRADDGDGFNLSRGIALLRQAAV